MNQEIPLDVGGTLVHEPTARARPTAATCALVTPAGAALASPTVTIDPVETTVAAAAAAGDTELVLATVAGIEPRRHYVLWSTTGELVQVRVRQVRTEDDTVVLFSPLRSDVAEASEFFGTRLTAPVTSGQAATLGEGYEARWTVTTDDGSRTYVGRWDVVRSAWPVDLVSPSDLERYAGALLTHEVEGADTYGLAYLDEIETATDDVRTDILEHGRRPSLFRSYVAFKTVVIERVLLNLAYLGRGIPAVDQGDPGGYRQLREARYSRVLSQALATTRDYDLDESGVADAVEGQQRMGTIRLIR